MRATISLPDDLFEAVRRRAGGKSFSDFARQSIVERLEKLERNRLEKAMGDGYRAEREKPSLDPEWVHTEIDSW